MVIVTDSDQQGSKLRLSLIFLNERYIVVDPDPELRGRGGGGGGWFGFALPAFPPSAISPFLPKIRGALP